MFLGDKFVIISGKPEIFGINISENYFMLLIYFLLHYNKLYHSYRSFEYCSSFFTWNLYDVIMNNKEIGGM